MNQDVPGLPRQTSDDLKIALGMLVRCYGVIGNNATPDLISDLQNFLFKFGIVWDEQGKNANAKFVELYARQRMGRLWHDDD